MLNRHRECARDCRSRRSSVFRDTTDRNVVAVIEHNNQAVGFPLAASADDQEITVGDTQRRKRRAFHFQSESVHPIEQVAKLDTLFGMGSSLCRAVGHCRAQKCHAVSSGTLIA